MDLEPFKQFPLEIYGRILKFCDVPTLASTSLFSLPFDLSSSFLYRDVTIEGEERLCQFFCSRTTCQSRIEPILSLSRVRSFTSILRKPLPSEPYSPQIGRSLLISRDRLPLSQPLEVKELHVLLHLLSTFHVVQTYFPFHHFNPSLVTLRAPFLTFADRNFIVYPSLHERLVWPRLTSLLNGELLPSRSQRQVLLREGGGPVLPLWFQGAERSDHVRIHTFVHTLLSFLGSSLRRKGQERCQRRDFRIGVREEAGMADCEGGGGSSEEEGVG
ncbi:hypothetical protein BDY24DRAFT_385613 [Mrakia frigida]|uniref:uncharacterized protein n=1 Tax=Mrakia frigida TaxID=29902 RepID=UPI003FCC220C